MQKNKMLRNHIMETYGTLARFRYKYKIPKHYTDIALEKKDFFHIIEIGLNLCSVLEIDPVKLFCEKEILVLTKEKTTDEILKDIETLYNSSDDIIKEQYILLSEEDRKKALEYADFLYEHGDGSGDIVK